MKHGSCRFVGSILLIHYRPASDSSTKLGLTVPKKFGAAPRRNRFKRIVREAFRQNRYLLTREIEMNILPIKGISDFSLESAARDLVDFFHHEPA